jgi:hypothetical protein
MERAKDTDKDCLNRDSFWLCGKVIAEPKIMGIAQVNEDRVEG